jgi:hypothetical protein
MGLIIHNPELEPKNRRPLEPVTVLTKAERMMRALNRWQRAGFKIAPLEERERRGGICDLCPHWKPEGNWGLGECTAPGCGCTRAKVWLATERCPLGKWEPITTTS